MTGAVLVTGGAGSIGSHTTRQLVHAGHRVTVLDNLHAGHRWAVDPAADSVDGDIVDHALLRRVIREARIDAVVHIAGHTLVRESVRDPLKYYRNDCLGSQCVIEACCHSCVSSYIFSSSAAAYGQPVAGPVTETSKATYVIKVACEAAADQRAGLEVFANDYSTPDGTCIRDYIHVEDLAAALVLALRYLKGRGAGRRG